MYLMPAEYALQAHRHMAEYGSTPEQFAQVAVKSHKNALKNPYAIVALTAGLCLLGMAVILFSKAIRLKVWHFREDKVSSFEEEPSLS